MRFEPNKKFSGYPCSYVGTGCAYEALTGEPFAEDLPEGLHSDGYLSLNDENRYIRSLLPVKKKVYFKRGERPVLKDFLEINTERCCVCVYGHFLYADGRDYWSFFNNDNDKIVCIWFLKDEF